MYFETWIAEVVGTPALNQQPVTIVGDGRQKHSFVSAADVASFAIAVLDHPAAMNRRLEIGGPESLTWLEVIALFEDVLGRAIEVRRVPPGESAPGLDEGLARVMAEMESKDSSVDMSDISRVYAVSQIRLEDFVRQTYGDAG